MRKIGQIFKVLIPVIALVALVVFMTGAGRRKRATLEKNKAIVLMRWNEELWNKGNMAGADEIIASDCVRHIAGLPDLVGPEAIKQYIVACRTAWPDWNSTPEMIIAEGDKVMVRWRCTGTHKGTAWGIPPTGNKANFITDCMYRIVGGKIVEMWEVTETACWLQMGFKLVPPGAEGGK